MPKPCTRSYPATTLPTNQRGRLRWKPCSINEMAACAGDLEAEIAAKRVAARSFVCAGSNVAACRLAMDLGPTDYYDYLLPITTRTSTPSW